MKRQFDEYDLKLIEWLKTFKNRAELRTHSNRTYNCLLNNFPFLLDAALPVKKWTLSSCKEQALKYKTRSEWDLNSESSYYTARKNGWLEECCKHMKKSKTAKRSIKCSNGEVYDSSYSAARALKLNPGSIHRVLRGKKRSTGGYTFVYVEEEND